MAGEDKSDGGGARILGVRRAHQGRRHVARAALAIEPAGDLDLLHVLPGRHRDTGQPLHRLVLRRSRLDQVDPDRGLRQSGKVGSGDFLQRGFRGDKDREHGGLQKSTPTYPTGLRCSGKRFMSHIHRHLVWAAKRRQGGPDCASYRSTVHGKPGFCGKNDTGAVPQRQSSI